MAKIRPTDKEKEVVTTTTTGTAPNMAGTTGSFNIDVNETNEDIEKQQRVKFRNDLEKQYDDDIEAAEKRLADIDAETAPPKSATPNTYEQWLANHPGETEEQRVKREKRERNRRRMAAIADGLIGLSNIVGAAKGATPVKQTSYSETERKQQKSDAAQRLQAQNFRDKYAYYAGKNNNADESKWYKEHESRRDKAYKELVAAKERKAKGIPGFDLTSAKISNTTASTDKITSDKENNKNVSKATVEEKKAKGHAATTTAGARMYSATHPASRGGSGGGSHRSGSGRGVTSTHTRTWEDDNGVKHTVKEPYRGSTGGWNNGGKKIKFN